MATLTPDQQAATDALAVVNDFLMTNLNWTVTPQPNGQLQWGFPAAPPPPPAPVIATIPNFLNVTSGFSVDLGQYVSGTSPPFISVTLANKPSEWTLTGSDGLVLEFGGPSASGPTAVQLTIVASTGTATSNSFQISGVASQSADIFSPSVPFNVAASLVSNKPTLSWLSSSDPAPAGYAWSGMKDYRVYRTVNGGPQVLVLSNGTTTPVGSVSSAQYSLLAPTLGLQFTPVAADIGSPAVAGSTVQTGSTLLISGGGLDFQGSSDQGQFAGAQINGNWIASFTLTAITGPEEFSSAGLNARGTLAAGAPCITAKLTPATTGGGYLLDFRAASGGATTDASSTLGNYTLPIPVMVQYAAGVTTMTVNGTAFPALTNAIGASMYLGAYATAHQATGQTVATLANFNVTQDGVLSFTDTSITQGTSAQVCVYTVTARDTALNESAASLSATVTVPAAGSSTTAGLAAGTGTLSGKFVNTLTGLEFLGVGCGMLGMETVQGGYTAGVGWARDLAIANLTAAQISAALTAAVNSLGASAKVYGTVNLFRLNINSAKWMATTGLDPFGNLSGNYYSVGTDSNGKAIYCGGPGGGLGSGPGHETSGNPILYRTQVKKILTTLRGMGYPVFLNMMWGAPIDVSTGQYVLPAGQQALPTDSDLLAWENIAADPFFADQGFVFELMNEPIGSNIYSNMVGTESAYLGSKSLTHFQFPTSTTSPAGTNGGYGMLNNIGSNNFANILGGGAVCYAVGFQQIINAIRAAGATNLIAAGCTNFCGEVETWSYNGGQMVLSDPNKNLCASFHAYGYNQGTAKMLAIQAAGIPFICTEMGNLSSAGGANASYVGYRSAGFSYIFWGWPFYEYVSNPAAGILGDYPWTQNGQVAPNGSN